MTTEKCKQPYESPKAELIKFGKTDIIITSQEKKKDKKIELPIIHF